MITLICIIASTIVALFYYSKEVYWASCLNWICVGFNLCVLVEKLIN